MANTLATILNDAGNRALVEKYLSTSLLERRDWGGVMANTMYFDDRGYSVKLMGKALVVDKPDPADLALVMTTYRAFTVDLAEGDTCA